MRDPGGSGHKALRKGRVSETGRIYFLTTVTRNRIPLFRDLFLGRRVVQTLRFAQERGQAQSWAYVLMPDHLHWLVGLPADQSLAALMRHVKAHSAKGINRARGIAGAAVWQSGFHDHALREEEEIRRVAQYLVSNPLRAGLVERLADYPLWDAVWVGVESDPTD